MTTRIYTYRNIQGGTTVYYTQQDFNSDGNQRSLLLRLYVSQLLHLLMVN
jgi:hypothetical protein